MSVRIGTSGWSYDHWEGVLYPPGLRPSDRLALYVAEFDTVELNASFYRWPRDSSFASWERRLPAGFRMSVKAPRGLTHAKRLYQPEVWAERIVSCWRALGDRRGILLVQLRPDHERDDARLDWFLSQLPSEVLVALELRHPSWQHDDVLALLERHHAAYVVMSGAGLPCVLQRPHRSCTSGSTVPTPTTCTRARTPRPISRGGPTGSGSGTARGATCGRTSTTTVAATPCTTPEPSAGASPEP